MKATWTVLLVLVPFACGPGTRNSPGGDDDSGGDGGNGGGGGGGGGGSATGSDGCSDDAKLIYVVDETDKLAKFDPMSKTFTSLGTLACATIDGIPIAEPFSMAVDRSAQAYVLYNDGVIYKVDTTNSALPCTQTSYTAQDGLTQFGMGFSTDTMGGSTDSLFIAGGPDAGSDTTSTLAKLDVSSMAASPVGTISGSPELTGNSDAELWAFSPQEAGTMPTVQQIDKASGSATITYTLASLAGQPAAWAFGFYGGDYWVFLAKNSESTSTVYEIAGPTNMSNTPGTVVGTTPANGLLIVGAGVSTCAPTMIF
ncbi:MAG TPA: hypothetical protein VH143_09900 [Kofleriaceae bacterium]|jgi:hypothetical protein|nr:hypothetical protein [Kofleriaceae bacterium]